MDIAIWLFGAVVTGLVVLPIHEIGHALAARICGWKVAFVSVFGLAASFGKHATAIPRKGKAAMFGGATAIFPIGGYAATPSQYVVVLLGGSIVQLIPIGALIALALLFDEMFAALIAMPVGNIVFSLVPMSMGGLPNDGMKILGLWKGGSDAQRERLRFTILAAELGEDVTLTENDLLILKESREETLRHYGDLYRNHDPSVP